MTPEPKRLVVDDPELDKVEEFMLELERRQFDRRKANRFKQFTQWAAVVGFCLTIGSCATAVATRMGWRMMGTPDDVVRLQKDMLEVSGRVAILEKNHEGLQSSIRFLVITKCMELTQREAQLAQLNCDAILNQAAARTGISP